MNLLHDYVAIRSDKPEETTSSGLYVQQQIKTYPPIGTIEAVAEGITDLKAGDRVVYKVYASVDINLNEDTAAAAVGMGDEISVIPYSGVIAKLT